MIKATHQRSGIAEKTLVRTFMGCQAEHRMQKRISRNLHVAKITKGSS